MTVSKTHLYQLTQVQYTSASGTTSTRTILPVKLPHPNVTALDVTDLSAEQQSDLRTAYAEYAEYIQSFMANAYKFEDYLEQCHPGIDGTTFEIKWRTFNPSTLEIIKDPQ